MVTIRGSKAGTGETAKVARVKAEGVRGTENDGTAKAIDEPMDAAERLVKELARVRAKFGMDPTDARELLAEAWMPPTAAMEEDESEFVDAVADCLGAGLPLEAALSCWDSGELAYEASADEEEAPPGLEMNAAVSQPHAPASGRRLLVR
ncbi:MAG: hypothetical protein QOI66_5386 [Myxococcales bacterium]|jgi:hypothetical protein|nr:hypothetical protein [Myxococcales bacterium]